MSNTKKTAQKKFKLVYLSALLPLVSTALYLLLMFTSQVEEFFFQLPTILAFIAVCAGWGFLGAAFAKSKTLLFPSVVIAHIIPTITTVAYTILYIAAQFKESEELQSISELIGILGTGLFSVIGSLLYAIIPLSLFEVYIDFVFSVLVFIVGYTIGASGQAKKK